jgi:hypothetical protein
MKKSGSQRSIEQYPQTQRALVTVSCIRVSIEHIEMSTDGYGLNTEEKTVSSSNFFPLLETVY